MNLDLEQAVAAVPRRFPPWSVLASGADPTSARRVVGPGPAGGANPPSPYDPTDAVYAAARMLCTNGAANGANLQAAVFAYNHSDTYATEVIALAISYGQTQAQTVAAGTAGGIAVDWALAQVGTPYIWGGESPGVGFDMLRSRPSRLRGGGDHPVPSGPGPVRRRTPTPSRHTARTGRSGVLRRRTG